MSRDLRGLSRLTGLVHPLQQMGDTTSRSASTGAPSKRAHGPRAAALWRFLQLETRPQENIDDQGQGLPKFLRPRAMRQAPSAPEPAQTTPLAEALEAIVSSVDREPLAWPVGSTQRAIIGGILAGAISGLLLIALVVSNASVEAGQTALEQPPTAEHQQAVLEEPAPPAFLQSISRTLTPPPSVTPISQALIVSELYESRANPLPLLQAETTAHVIGLPAGAQASRGIIGPDGVLVLGLDDLQRLAVTFPPGSPRRIMATVNIESDDHRLLASMPIQLEGERMRDKALSPASETSPELVKASEPPSQTARTATAARSKKKPPRVIEKSVASGPPPAKAGPAPSFGPSKSAGTNPPAPASSAEATSSSQKPASSPLGLGIGLGFTGSTVEEGSSGYTVMESLGAFR